jgi:hypothetical protein
MIVNFRTREISRSTWKLVWIFILKKIKFWRQLSHINALPTKTSRTYTNHYPQDMNRHGEKDSITDDNESASSLYPRIL